MGAITSIVTGVATSATYVAGFTSNGVLAWSIAAAIQSTIGNVGVGTAFSILQSIGATTVLGTVAAPIVGGVAIVGGAVILISRLR